MQTGLCSRPSSVYYFLLNAAQAVFGSSSESVYFHTRSDGNFFKPASLKAKRKVRRITICDTLFVDEAAVVVHSEQYLQALMNIFAKACEDFGLTISKGKTKVLSQETTTPPEIALYSTTIEVVQNLVHFWSNIRLNTSIHAEIDYHTGIAVTTCAHLSVRG